MMSDGWQRDAEPMSFEEAFEMQGLEQLDIAYRLMKRLVDTRPMRWATLKNFSPTNGDVVDVERVVLHCLFRVGWVEIRYRLDRRGRETPTQVRAITPVSGDVRSFVSEQPGVQQTRRATELLTALRRIRDDPAFPTPIPERCLVQRVFGHTKAVRIRDYRDQLESELGVPLERLVRFHVHPVLTAGPLRYRFRDFAIDAHSSWPWLAITERVAAELTDLDVQGTEELICVENQTPFESIIHDGVAESAVIVFTSGYPGKPERTWITRLIRDGGIRRVRHWGDLDPHGLIIYRDLVRLVRGIDATVDVRPWQMEPAHLERPDALPLESAERAHLRRYLDDPDVPLRPLALAMERLGRKLEQEALLPFPTP